MTLTRVLLASGLLTASVLVPVQAENVETPMYQVIRQDGRYEVRDYSAFLVAQKHCQGTRKEAVYSGFRTLADYIFARNRAGARVAMTAPVLQQPAEEREFASSSAVRSHVNERDWYVSFIMPAGYTLASLPAPANPVVQLQEEPARRVAVVRFNGTPTDELLAAQEQLLRTWMNGQGLQPQGAPSYAYYNPPFIPGFLKRNEVLLAIAPAQ